MSNAPSSDDPGRANTPDAPGGPPGVTDRVSPGPPPPASNQARDEGTLAAPETTPGADTVASAHPQSPPAVPAGGDSASAVAAAAGRVPGAPGATPEEVRPHVDLGSARGGGERPASGTAGYASRVPGQQPTVDSPLDPVAALDAARTAAGAPPQSVSAAPTPGNPQGVSVPATDSAPGTSQESNIVTGVRSSPEGPAGADRDHVSER